MTKLKMSLQCRYEIAKILSKDNPAQTQIIIEWMIGAIDR